MGTAYLELAGEGATYLHAIGTKTTPFITIGTPDTSNFVRRVQLRNLSISGNGNYNSSTQTSASNWISLSINQCQDLLIHDVWINGINQGVAYATDMYDSVWLNVSIIKCGHATSDTDYAYAVTFNGLIDQCNANKFIARHIEDYPLYLHFMANSRFNCFEGKCKFEGPSAPADSVSDDAAVLVREGP